MPFVPTPPRFAIHVRSCLPLACALLLATSASAQDTDADHYDGQWNATVQAADGSKRKARVTVADFGGSWQDLPARSGKMDKACTGRKFEITVQRSLPDRMEFMVWGTPLAPQCANLAAELKPVDDQTLEGTLGDATVRLTRIPLRNAVRR